MKNLKYIALLFGVIGMILAAVTRIFLSEKILFGLASITYLRVTMTMLLFALAFHFLFQDN